MYYILVSTLATDHLFYTQQQFCEETGHKPSETEFPGWHKQTLTAVSTFSLFPFQVNKRRI